MSTHSHMHSHTCTQLSVSRGWYHAANKYYLLHELEWNMYYRLYIECRVISTLQLFFVFDFIPHTISLDHTLPSYTANHAWEISMNYVNMGNI